MCISLYEFGKCKLTPNLLLLCYQNQVYEPEKMSIRTWSGLTYQNKYPFVDDCLENRASIPQVLSLSPLRRPLVINLSTNSLFKTVFCSALYHWVGLNTCRLCFRLSLVSANELSLAWNWTTEEKENPSISPFPQPF